MSGTSFRFRLERVRALRERSEDAAKQALAEAMATRTTLATEALDRAQAQVAAAQAAQSAAATATRTVSELLGHQAFLERSERAVLASRQDLHRHEHHLDLRRHELTQAARERQALERLKENRRADHDRELARREAVDLDEIAITEFSPEDSMSAMLSAPAGPAPSGAPAAGAPPGSAPPAGPLASPAVHRVKAGLRPPRRSPTC